MVRRIYGRILNRIDAKRNPTIYNRARERMFARPSLLLWQLVVRCPGFRMKVELLQGIIPELYQVFQTFILCIARSEEKLHNQNTSCKGSAPGLLSFHPLSSHWCWEVVVGAALFTVSSGLACIISCLHPTSRSSTTFPVNSDSNS